MRRGGPVYSFGFRGALPGKEGGCLCGHLPTHSKIATLWLWSSIVLRLKYTLNRLVWVHLCAPQRAHLSRLSCKHSQRFRTKTRPRQLHLSLTSICRTIISSSNGSLHHQTHRYCLCRPVRSPCLRGEGHPASLILAQMLGWYPPTHPPFTTPLRTLDLSLGGEDWGKPGDHVYGCSRGRPETHLREQVMQIK